MSDFSRENILNSFKTAWIFNLRRDLRLHVQGIFADLTTHFFQNLPLPRLQALSERITASSAPVALFVTPPTSDEKAFFAELGVPVARLREVPFLIAPRPDSSDLIPCGYFLEAVDAPEESAYPADLRAALASPETLLGTGEEAEARARAALDRLVAATRALDDGAAVPGKPWASGPMRKAAIFANDAASPLELAPAAFEAYAALAQKAREQCPGWDITFFTNGETEIPGDIAAPLRAAVTYVDHTPYSQALLGPFARVFVHDSVAAIDALVAGKQVILSATSQFRTDPEQPEAPAQLPGVFAALMEQRSLLADPVSGMETGLVELAQAIAAQRRLTGTSPTMARVQAFWTRLSAEAGAVLEPLTPSSSWSVRKSQFETPGGGAGSLSLPGWVSETRRTVPASGAGTFAALRSDILRAPADVQTAPVEIIEIDAAWTEPGSARRVSDLAIQKPEAFDRLVEWKLGGFTGRFVLVTDLDDPASRLFARAARRLGLVCAYLPPSTVSIEDGAYQSDPLVLHSTIVDVLIAWDRSHVTLSRAVGFPQGRVYAAAVTAPAPATTPARDAPGLIVHMVEGVPAGRETRADDLVSSLASLAQAIGQNCLLHAGSAFYAQLSEKSLAQLERLSTFRFEIAPFVDVPVRDRLASRPVLVTQDRSFAWEAQRMGVPVVLCPTEIAEEDGEDDPYVRAIMHAVSAALDEIGVGARRQPLSGAPLAELLAELGAADIRNRGSALEMVLGNTGDRINLVSSSVSLETLQKTERYELPMLRADSWIRATALSSLSDLIDVDLFVQWGIRANNTRAVVASYARRLKRDVLILEDGFIRSIEIGLSGTPALSILMDDMTAFYDATRPSRLETILNSDFAVSEADQKRARAAIDSIVANKITKYNFAPYKKVRYGSPDRKKILIVDQRAGDQSIESGLASPDSFRDMVRQALAMAGEYDILVKTHPDANIGGKSSAISPELLRALATHPNAYVITDDMNAHSIIDSVEKVFVVTSGLGFESAMAGKEVWCFGVPFYAGWGITKDMRPLPRRKKTRSIEDIFFVTYIMLSRYFHPDWDRVCQVEDIIGYIRDTRPWTMTTDDATVSDAAIDSDAPEVTSTDLVPAGATLWLLGPSKPEQEAFKAAFSGSHDVRVARKTASVIEFYNAVLATPNPVLVDFTGGSINGLKAFLRSWNLSCYKPTDFGTVVGAE